MMRLEGVITLFPDLDQTELVSWVERHWVQPDTSATGEEEVWIFTEIDVARVRLIYDLRRDLDIAEEMVPLMLSLLDQVYDLRCTLKSMSRAIAAQPPELQAAIRAAMTERED